MDQRNDVSSKSKTVHSDTAQNNGGSMKRRDHLRLVCHNGVPVRVVYRGHCSSDVKMIYPGSEDKGLGMLMPHSPEAPRGNVSVSYDMGAYTHTFEAHVIDSERLPSGQYLVHLTLPKKIVRIERRHYQRTSPSPEKPLHLQVASGKGPIPAALLDISHKGLGFATPNSKVAFEDGDTVSANLTLPTRGSVQLEAVVRTKTELSSENTRYGVEIQAVTDSNREELVDYVCIRQVEIVERGGAAGEPAKKSIVLTVRKDGVNEPLRVCQESPENSPENIEAFARAAGVDVVDAGDEQGQEKSLTA